jgi:hypothetical protein
VKVPSFKALDIDTNIGIGYGLAAADVDGDGKTDILLVDKDLVAWYQNPKWEKHVIAEKLSRLDHVCIAAADIDGDGKAEIAVGAEWNPGDTTSSGAVFYLVPPADRTTKWHPIALPHEPTVHRMRWVMDGERHPMLIVAPLHGRGNKNGQGDGVRILAYRMPSDPKEPWRTEQIDGSLHMTHNFDPIQWDTDPAPEFLVAGKEGTFLIDSAGPSWHQTQLGGAESGGAGEVRLGRLGPGKRFFATVEPMHGTNLVLYREPRAEDSTVLWKRKVLDSTLVDGHALACGDLAGIHRDQIVVGWRAMNKPGAKVGIKLFTPVDAEGQEWQSTLIDDNTMACEDLLLTDLNADGRLDIVAAGRATKNVKIYLNQGVQ